MHQFNVILSRQPGLNYNPTNGEVDFENARKADDMGNFESLSFGLSQVISVVYYADPKQLTQRHELDWNEFDLLGRPESLQFLISASYAASGLSTERSDDFSPLYVVSAGRGE